MLGSSTAFCILVLPLAGLGLSFAKRWSWQFHLGFGSLVCLQVGAFCAGYADEEKLILTIPLMLVASAIALGTIAWVWWSGRMLRFSPLEK